MGDGGTDRNKRLKRPQIVTWNDGHDGISTLAGFTPDRSAYCPNRPPGTPEYALPLAGLG